MDFPAQTNFSFALFPLLGEDCAHLLLERPAVCLDMEEAGNLLRGQVVMVTGGAGSIGSELCRQALALGCRTLVVYDHWENGLFYLDRSLRPHYKGRYVLINGSVTDRCQLMEIMGRYRPAILFHAAANKHVPMVELNPRQAVKTNLLGSLFTARAALKTGVERFILISTDKAVNPANVMGATKRGAELSIQLLARKKQTVFAAVRFGNVLGSAGSVVPIFAQQIAQGGPVTITHPDMTRYFMTIPEAVGLVLQTAALAKGGEIFALDMGEPVSILDLARRMISLAGLEPEKDIPIQFTGTRPGEKLYEELCLAEEHTLATGREKIFINSPLPLSPEVESLLETLEAGINQMDLNQLLELLHQLVPTFDHRR